MTHDDYNFQQYIERLRTLFKDILLKPIILQLLLDFPDLEKNNKLYNDIDLIFYGHSELIKAKMLSNMQAKATIANDLQNNLKREDDKPMLHWRFRPRGQSRRFHKNAPYNIYCLKYRGQ